MFKILPDKIKWKHVWLGSIVTGILFTIGKTLLAFYFSIANPASVYGLQVRHLVLLWVSYSSMILFFELNLRLPTQNLYWYSSSLRNRKGTQTVKKIAEFF
jgi:uncharacterized BrkB/YihY/UPF0761 family membrane protein